MPDPGTPQTLQRPDGTHTASAWNPAATATPLLALHGFTGSGADWAPLAPHVVRSLVAPDLLGHGHSPAPADPAAYAIDAVVDHTLAWCDGSPRWFVVGYSMGGRVALRLAHRLGDRLAGMVLVSTSPGLEDPADRHARIARDAALADRIEAEGMEWFAAHWAEHPVIRSQRAIPPDLLAPMTERRRRNHPAGLAGSLRGMGQGAVEPVWDDLPGLSAPTLWITGDDDATYTSIAARAVDLLPRGRHLAVPGVGHCTHLEALGAVGPAIRGFLDALDPPAGSRSLR